MELKEENEDLYVKLNHILAKRNMVTDFAYNARWDISMQDI